MKHPADTAFNAVERTMDAGSKKDGRNEHWRHKDPMYHLSKAINHLATHIKQIHDHRTHDGENHLALALTRIAMVMTNDT